MAECSKSFDSAVDASAVSADGFVVQDVRIGERATMALHTDESAQLYVPASEGVVEQAHGKRRPWATGQLEFRPPGWTHVLHVPRETRMLVIGVERWRFETLANLVPSPLQDSSIPAVFLRGISERLLESLRTGDALARIMVPALVLELVAQAVLVCRSGASRSPVVEQARTLVRQNLSGSLTVRQIASTLHVSRRALSRAFQAVAGESLPQYASRTRREEALHLIVTTNLSLKEIAARVGFYDQAHMSRHIKRATGRTPLAHRRGRG